MLEPMNRISSGLVCLVFMVWPMMGCSSPTQREIGDRYKTQIDQLVADFRELASAIPRQDAELTGEPLYPTPYYHIADPMSNMVVLSRQELDGEYHDIDDPNNFSLFAAEGLKNQLDARYLAEPAEDAARFEAEMKALGETPYILAYDLIDFKPAVFSDSTFEVSPMRMAVSLYDRRTKQWRACRLFEFMPPDEIEFKYKEWEKEATAHSELGEHFRKQAMEQISKYVSATFGGRAEFDLYAVQLDGTRFKP